MKIKVLALPLAAALFLSGCMTIQNRLDRARFGDNPYEESPFYMRYVGTESPLDRRITELVTALRADPGNPVLHNELGMALVEKRFPNDAKREFRRALAADDDFYPAWYNLALIRASQNEVQGALTALDETIERKPGHAAALFQRGLLLERLGRDEAAIASYAKAFRINFDLLDPKVNPGIIESELIDLALLELYPAEHAARTITMQPTPPELLRRDPPSDQPSPDEIVPPATQEPPPPPSL